MKLRLRRGGYWGFGLKHRGKENSYYVHRLVAMAFLGGPSGDKIEVNHIDGDKLNSRVDNLEWGTHKHNIQHAIRPGLKPDWRGEECPWSTLNEDTVREIRQRYRKGQRPSQYELAEEYGLCQSHINDSVLRKIWKHVKKKTPRFSRGVVLLAVVVV